MSVPVLELDHVSKTFGSVVAIEDVSVGIYASEVMCLLGDNGAGKSTVIKIMSGVHQPSGGIFRMDGAPRVLRSPRDARQAGIATVFQDLAVAPLMSVTRNFFMGREPLKGWGPFRQFDLSAAGRIASAELARMGIEIRDADQPVGTLSGGERQCVAIARAIYFGAKVLILDEPTSALGVHQAEIVTRMVQRARAHGVAVVLITHNIEHAYPVGDRFTLLRRGRSLGTFLKSEISKDKVVGLMGADRISELSEYPQGLGAAQSE
jgi:simple sugar transport system ATP-binding protein